MTATDEYARRGIHKDSQSQSAAHAADFISSALPRQIGGSTGSDPSSSRESRYRLVAGDARTESSDFEMIALSFSLSIEQDSINECKYIDNQRLMFLQITFDGYT